MSNTVIHDKIPSHFPRSNNIYPNLITYPHVCVPGSGDRGPPQPVRLRLKPPKSDAPPLKSTRRGQWRTPCPAASSATAAATATTRSSGACTPGTAPALPPLPRPLVRDVPPGRRCAGSLDRSPLRPLRCACGGADLAMQEQPHARKQGAQGSTKGCRIVCKSRSVWRPPLEASSALAETSDAQSRRKSLSSRR